MRNLITALLFVAIFVAQCEAKVFVVTDTEDGGPIAGATIIGKSGVIMGLTDDKGQITVDDNETPITIRCIGYDPVTATLKDDTVRMSPSAFRLNEVVVSPIDRPVKRVVCFAREYSSGITGTDTMQYYCEYMADAFVVDGKVKGYKKQDSRMSPKNHRRYARIVKEGRDSIFKPNREDDITLLSWFPILAVIPVNEEVPEAILNGCEADTVHGKYGPSLISRRKNGFYTKTADVLSDHKDHKWSPFIFKLFGLTTDLDRGLLTTTFVDRGSKSYDVHDLVCATYNLHIIGRGKWIKKVFDSKQPIEMDTYLELYPMEITHHTIEEYKELREDKSTIDFRFQENIEPLSPAIDNLVNRIDGLQK